MASENTPSQNRLFLRSLMAGLLLGAAVSLAVKFRRAPHEPGLSGAATAFQTRPPHRLADDDPVAKSLEDGKANARRRRAELGMNG
jgi:hypothetical protein